MLFHNYLFYRLFDYIVFQISDIYFWLNLDDDRVVFWNPAVKARYVKIQVSNEEPCYKFELIGCRKYGTNL